MEATTVTRLNRAFDGMKADGITALTLSELTKLTGATYQTLHNYVQQKRIPASRETGTIMVPLEDARKWAVGYVGRKATAETRDITKYLK